MEPGDHELLVHITAPSTARHDKKYVALAKSVLGFRPAIMTRVCGPEPDTLAMITTGESSGVHEIEMSLNTGRAASNRPNSPRPSTAPQLTTTTDSADSNQVGGRRKRAHSDPSVISDSFSSLASARLERIRKKVRVQSPEDVVSRAPHDERSSQSKSNTSRLPKTPRGGQFRYDDSSTNCTDESTQSASSMEFLKLNCATPTPCASLQAHAPASVPDVVDLTTPDQKATESYPTPTSRPMHVERDQSPYPPSRNRISVPGRWNPIQDRIRQRPDQIEAPLPQESELKFTTHMTSHLEEFTPLLRHFQPAFVGREIRVLERGYWQFRVRIAEENIVEESRRPPKPTLKLLGSTARKKKREKADLVNDAHSTKVLDALWTEDEFVKFWEALAWVIEMGRAGWGTRLVKDAVAEGIWMVRLLTWGELLAHAWFLLFHVSDKLTGELSMDWVAASGQVVVRMSRKEHLRGTWERKGVGVGGEGVWHFKQG